MTPVTAPPPQSPGGSAPQHPASGALATVRRIVMLVLLAVMVILAANGLSGLLGRLLDVAGYQLAAYDVPGLAMALAFTLIAGPLAGVLWWFLWRILRRPEERGSVAWGLYVGLLYVVSLLSALSGVLGVITQSVDGRWDPYGLGSGIAWGLVWLWHRWMLRGDRGPTRIADLGPVIGAAFGLLAGTGGAVAALGAVFGEAVSAVVDGAAVGEPWWRPALRGLVWAVGGGVVWWAHWRGDRVVALRTGFARVMLVILTALAGLLPFAAGVATTLYVVLRLVFDASETPVRIVEPLGTAVAAAAVGAVVWAYHRRVVAHRSPPTREASRLVSSAIGLVAAASGIGVVVNAILASLTTPLAGTGPLLLLLGGISALVVGGPIWWFSWRPLTAGEPGDRGRRVYLVLVFGAAGIVALITLIVLGYRLLENALEPTGGLLERVRAPLGLLVATGLAAGYHFAVWIRERTAVAFAPPRPRLTRVQLVAGGDAGALADAVADACGAVVVADVRADGAPTTVTAQAIAAALAAVPSERALVLVGPGDRLEVVPLA